MDKLKKRKLPYYFMEHFPKPQFPKYHWVFFSEREDAEFDTHLDSRELWAILNMFNICFNKNSMSIFNNLIDIYLSSFG